VQISSIFERFGFISNFYEIGTLKLTKYCDKGLNRAGLFKVSVIRIRYFVNLADELLLRA